MPKQAKAAAGAAARGFSSAGHRVGSFASSHLSGVGQAASSTQAWLGSAAGRSRDWVTSPAVASQLEMALGLALIALTGTVALRSIRQACLPAGPHNMQS